MRSGALVLFLVVLAGCPDSNKTGGDAAAIASATLSGKPQKPAKKTPETKTPEASSKEEFPRDVLIELYRADILGDKEPARKHGLLDAKGQEVPAKVAEYEAALKRFAEEHGDELSRIADELDAARVTSANAPAVEKK